MDFLCVKQITFGERTYLPGERIPDAVVLPERVNKLKAFGYITPTAESADGKTAQRMKQGEEESRQTKQGKKTRKESEEVKA